jgi:5-methylcytosine-specific restriction enzyme A
MKAQFIRDLPLPVMAAKADWLVSDHWLGFTPTDGSGEAQERCRSTITKQFRGGYVLEYITLKFGEPNSDFLDDPLYRTDRDSHRKVAGRLVAIHRLRPSSRPLRTILGDAEFNRIQDMWAEQGKRHRWSVAFPIIESFSIINPPLANEVFTGDQMRRIFAHPSATLRPLSDDERRAIGNLEIVSRPVLNAWVGIEDEITMAEASEIAPAIQRAINIDLGGSALEGMTDERKVKIRLRAAWLAERFVKNRRAAGLLCCDECGFDPIAKTTGTQIKPRSLMDVHHRTPLDEGKRYTNLQDFMLLCPTCHRFIHQTMRVSPNSITHPIEKVSP